MQRENRFFGCVVALLCLALMLVAGACAGDMSPSPSDGQPAQEHAATPDGPAGGEAGSDAMGPCKDGDKICKTLQVIQECQNGTWVTIDDCTGKTYNGNPCNCSITMMFQCTFGTNVCQ